MAIMQCPECGQNISDKAPKCVHCGKDFSEDLNNDVPKKCLECGADISDSDTVCPSCGCPTEIPESSTTSTIQAVEVAGVKISKKTKKIAIISLVAIAVCVLSIFAIQSIGNMQAEKEFTSTYNEYIDNLEVAQLLMITGGADAEALSNLTYDVWRNAIYEERDYLTDQYTRPYGYFVDDFNIALANLFEASSTITTVSDIEANQAAVKELIKNLQNPPEGLENCYNTVSDLHSAYKTLTDLAISPSGNLTGFSDNVRSATSDFMDAYEKLDNQIPERKADK